METQMERYSETYFRKMIADRILNGSLEMEVDPETGEILFPTRHFENQNGLIQNIPDPDFRTTEEREDEQEEQEEEEDGAL
jgi:hypothetical protein